FLVSRAAFLQATFDPGSNARAADRQQKPAANGGGPRGRPSERVKLLRHEVRSAWPLMTREGPAPFLVAPKIPRPAAPRVWRSRRALGRRSSPGRGGLGGERGAHPLQLVVDGGDGEGHVEGGAGAHLLLEAGAERGQRLGAEVAGATLQRVGDAGG